MARHNIDVFVNPNTGRHVRKDKATFLTLLQQHLVVDCPRILR
jgi:hypothetical protein